LATRVVSNVASLIPPALFHTAIARVHHRAEPVMRQMVNACDPDGTAVDVGGWQGPWTYWLSRRVADVVTVEPNPTLAANLRRVVRSNTTIIEAAASDRRGRATLHIPIAGKGSEGTATLEDDHGSVLDVEVDTVTLDDLELTNVRFIKIDVEGHERNVLDGAKEILRSQRPVVLVELDTRFTDITGSVNLLTGLGYEGRSWWEGRWRRSSDLDLGTWQRQHLHVAGTRSYLRSVVSGPNWLNDVAWVHPDSTWSPW
jgi:FkbM family methyltransferase